MIPKQMIIKAMRVLRGEELPQDAVVAQLVASLLIYKQRGEFTGYVGSAVECLEEAGYEVEEL